MAHGRLLGRDELAGDLRGRSDGARVVLANGCFDVLHVGHLRYLEGARELGDLLVVAVNTDESVRRLKGEGRPLVPFDDRVELLLALRPVDFVVPFDEPDLENTLRVLRPHVHAKGTDYTLESVPEREVDLELGIEIAITGDPKERSSTDLIERLSPDAPGR